MDDNRIFDYFFAIICNDVYNYVSFEQQLMSGLLDSNHFDIKEQCVNIINSNPSITHTHSINVEQITSDMYTLTNLIVLMVYCLII